MTAASRRKFSWSELFTVNKMRPFKDFRFPVKVTDRSNTIPSAKNPSSPTKFGIRCLLIATGTAMGLSVPLSKEAVLAGVGPLSFSFFPALIGASFLGLLAYFRHGLPQQSVRLVLFGIISGLLGVAIPNTLVAWVSIQAGAGVTAIAYMLPPALTLCLSILLGLEYPRWQRAIAVAVAVTGGLLLAFSRYSEGHISIIASAILLLIPLSLAAGNVYRSIHLPREVPTEWLGASMSIGAALLLFPAWLIAPSELSQIKDEGTLYLASQVALSVCASLLYFMLQKRADAVTMSFIGYVIAFTSILVGAIFLDEEIPLQIIPSAVLIVFGFYLIQTFPAKTRTG